MLNSHNPKPKKVFHLADKGTIKSAHLLHMAQDLSWNYGEDVVIYDVRDRTPFVSYYLVASAANDHRLGLLVTAAKDTLNDNYYDLKHTEGRNDSKWILLDAADVVVQLFTKEERNRIAFDELYQDCPHQVVKALKEPVYRRKAKPKSQQGN